MKCTNFSAYFLNPLITSRKTQKLFDCFYIPKFYGAIIVQVIIKNYSDLGS